MSNPKLIELHNLVCAALTADPFEIPHQTAIDALTQIPIRDAFLRFLFDEPSSRKLCAANLRTLLDSCVDHEKAAIATLLAGCHWLDEDRTETLQALEMALSSDSTYSLARLLDVALNHSVPPSVWADSLSAVSTKQCLDGAA